MTSKRFFSDSSFWNQPIPESVEVSSNNAAYSRLLREFTAFNININEWTIPVYYADANTPRYRLKPKLPECPLSQGHFVASQPYLDDNHPTGIHESAQGLVPIPDEAVPDGENDAHMAVVDTSEQRVYDFWQVRRNTDGSWSTNSAIAHDLEGTGVYPLEDFANVHNNESIHYYGPCRASGVPSVAGLIMHHEIQSGKIEHKLAFACTNVGLQEFCHPPAVWTDGWRPGGIPEGITLQLDPALDLDIFQLTPAARTVAQALQEYGAALVDYAGGATLYAEGVLDGSNAWDGLLTTDSLRDIGLEHFRFLEPERVIRKGSHPVYHCGMSLLFYRFLREQNCAAPRPLWVT